jgi:parallel beta-helix repeat protein
VAAAVAAGAGAEGYTRCALKLGPHHRRIGGCVLGTVLSMLAVTAAEARKIEAKPGKNTLQKAVDKAKSGDTVQLEKGGKYTGGVVVETKGLKIKGPNDGKLPLVDGRCKVSHTVLVLARDVTLRNLRATGATGAFGQYTNADITYIENGTGTVDGVKLDDACDTLYGVNIFDTGDVTVKNSVFNGYDDAGVYVGGIQRPDANVKVADSVATRNHRGILFEDSFGNAGLEVTGNEVRLNQAGFFVFNSDGIEISDNTAIDNPFVGFWLDPNADDNRLIGNVGTGNGWSPDGGPRAGDLINDGQRNCGTGNSFPITSGQPLAPC